MRTMKKGVDKRFGTHSELLFIVCLGVLLITYMLPRRNLAYSVLCRG